MNIHIPVSDVSVHEPIGLYRNARVPLCAG